MESKPVVTSFLQSRDEILLLRRSGKVGSYQGRWATVSGYLEGDEDPLKRARTEIMEELGLGAEQVTFVRGGSVLRAFDEDVNTVWVVHPFLFRTMGNSIRLDWEHTEYRWIKPNELASFETVPKLKETYDRVRWDTGADPAAFSKVLSIVLEFGQDRIHGASFLGRRAVEIIAEAAKASDASAPEELFRDILLTTWKLRKAQPGMATVGNLTGQLLYRMNSGIRRGPSLEEFRNMVISMAKQVTVEAADASEDAARSTVALLPEEGVVLTHSYSSTVRRTLELGMKGGRKLTVYATESYPGFEGKELAKDLVNLRIPVKLITDSAATSIVPDVDLVLVGADSVLADGSLIHKVGTKRIAASANARSVPVYVSCETAKFDTNDFLGEHPEYSTSLYDLTPSMHLSGIMTEFGSITPGQVGERMRVLLRELYT
jgi:translation initiation factor 2B subunit (eIF-2B alpha/beta/delta family)/8-oxo-dGTP pyrophosphatase MutT (NUDIX family)